MQTQRKSALLALGAALSLTLAGCSGSAESSESLAPIESPETRSEDSVPGANGHSQSAAERGADLATTNFTVSWQEAVEIAQAEFAGELTEIELKWSDGRYAYEVDLISGADEYDVHVDADTGDTFEAETDTTDDVSENQAKIIDIGGIVSWDDALATALNAVAGAVDEWKLTGTSDGPEYDFEIIDSSGEDYEVEINALTGELISIDG